MPSNVLAGDARAHSTERETQSNFVQTNKESQSLVKHWTTLSTAMAGQCIAEHDELIQRFRAYIKFCLTTHSSFANNGKLRGFAEISTMRVEAIEKYVHAHQSVYGDLDSDRVEAMLAVSDRLRAVVDEAERRTLESQMLKHSPRGLRLEVGAALRGEKSLASPTRPDIRFPDDDSSMDSLLVDRHDAERNRRLGVLFDDRADNESNKNPDLSLQFATPPSKSGGARGNVIDSEQQLSPYAHEQLAIALGQSERQQAARKQTRENIMHGDGLQESGGIGHETSSKKETPRSWGVEVKAARGTTASGKKAPEKKSSVQSQPIRDERSASPTATPRTPSRASKTSTPRVARPTVPPVAIPGSSKGNAPAAAEMASAASAELATVEHTEAAWRQELAMEAVSTSVGLMAESLATSPQRTRAPTSAADGDDEVLAELSNRAKTAESQVQDLRRTVRGLNAELQHTKQQGTILTIGGFIFGVLFYAFVVPFFLQTCYDLFFRNEVGPGA